MEIRRYATGDNDKLVDLFSTCFESSPNYWAFANSLFENPAFKLGGHVMFVAESDGEIVGFSHGGSGKIYCLGVHPEHRRSGIGRKLVAALKLSLGPASTFDWQCHNPFWGNAVAIRTVPFGMVEGIGMLDSAPEALFFTALRASKVEVAINLATNSDTFKADYAREKRQLAEAHGFEFGIQQNRAPEVGSLLSAEQDHPTGRYFTAVALHGQQIAGRCVVFAQPELDAGRFGIWELEVAEEHRRKGVAAALVWNSMLEMQCNEFSKCEVTTVPHLSPNGIKFYESLGFEQAEKFALFE